jgi:hypothetical protein
MQDSDLDLCDRVHSYDEPTTLMHDDYFGEYTEGHHAAKDSTVRDCALAIHHRPGLIDGQTDRTRRKFCRVLLT